MTSWCLACKTCNPLNSPSFTANWRSNFTLTRTAIPKQRTRSKGFNALWIKQNNLLETPTSRHKTCLDRLHSSSELKFFTLKASDESRALGRHHLHPSHEHPCKTRLQDLHHIYENPLVDLATITTFLTRLTMHESSESQSEL